MAIVVNSKEKKAEIDLSKNMIVVIKDGNVTPIEAPETGYGEQTAIWKDGKVIDVVKQERVRIT